MPKTKSLCTPVPVQPAYSIAQFCCQHGISRALFYKLLQEGRGPRIMKAGRRTLISHDSDGTARKSPSEAAVKITGKNWNGWLFWHCKRPGDAAWLLINNLRDDKILGSL